ncbi:7SK snRNA methylphosphate capping enzyme-like [Mercenaria mercenaria]|uniref:7SK snRNA methylphosphate capping enzyme-like n=1 Tax=Mercenaria mercenaria TaxID=6596 RepID=UPI00234E889E|nr:7SK snRNA methylphosphate capping enzyme-like [Mercenaria mercenaria]
MSVQVKTPTKTRFDCRTEIQCGEKSFSSPESYRKSKDDLSIKNETRFSQPWGRKRRYSQSYRREEGAARRKRLRSTPYIGPLPSRFLNGGSIDDPLNLNGLDSSELGKELNSVTPQSSPLPAPVRRQSVEVRIPFNITDPLNLNDSDEEADLEKKLRKKKQRNRHKKKDDSLLFSPPKHLNKDKNLMEALKIDIEPEKAIPDLSGVKEFTKPRPVCDKIVSPVIPQTSPKSKKRRRTDSGGKPDPSPSVSRSLPTSTISPSLKPDKKTPPKRFKQPKPSQAKASSSVQKGDKAPAKFIYGNYNRYYGYRTPSSMEDKRLNCFKKEWFDGKRVLDIGCNVGNLTLSLAKDYHPSKIVGIDIDPKLVALARKNIRLFMSSNVTDTTKFPISNVLNYGPIIAPPVSQKESNKQANFPHNVLFMQGNFVLESDELLDLQKEEYDVILALSVTKWIHFNWGDDGLKRFFKRVFRQLKPGGRFILEPQPWSSYKKKKKLTEEIFQNFQNIHLRPDQFTDYLLSKEIGFSTCNTVDVPYNASKGFRRPIIVFTKSDTVQNSPWSEVGNATPLRSSHPAVFGSHLSQISEDSCCSCSSVSQQSSASEHIDVPVLSQQLLTGEDIDVPVLSQHSLTKDSVDRAGSSQQPSTNDSADIRMLQQSSPNDSDHVPVPTQQSSVGDITNENIQSDSYADFRSMSDNNLGKELSKDSNENVSVMDCDSAEIQTEPKITKKEISLSLSESGQNDVSSTKDSKDVSVSEMDTGDVPLLEKDAEDSSKQSLNEKDSSS